MFVPQMPYSKEEEAYNAVMPQSIVYFSICSSVIIMNLKSNNIEVLNKMFLLQSSNLHKVERSSHEDRPHANDNDLWPPNDTLTMLFD